MNFKELLQNDIEQIIKHPEQQALINQSIIQKGNNLTLATLEQELKKQFYLKSYYEEQLKNPEITPEAKATIKTKLFELEQYKNKIQKKISELIK